MYKIFLTILIVSSLSAAEQIKSVNAVAKANIKAIGAVAEANIKAVGVVDNTGSGGSPPVLENKLEFTSNNNTVNTYNVSFTTSGSDRLLTVAINYNDSARPDITTLTYNGVSFRANVIAATNHIDADGTNICFYLINPASGANTLNIVWESGGVNVQELAIITSAWSGVHQTTPVSGAQMSSSMAGTSTSSSVTVSATANDIVVDYLGYYPDQTYTPGTGQSTVATADATDSFSLISSQEAGATSTVMSWSTTPAVNLSQIGFAIKGL